MELKKTAENINILADFCGVRDIEELRQNALKEKYGFEKADVLILFGGSIPAGCDTAAAGYLNGAARRLMIVGGEGHTTEFLRQNIHDQCPEIETNGRMEADIMEEYISQKYGIQNILIERTSTNCGNNITNALEVLKNSRVETKNVILMQDAAMQRRMWAGFAKHTPDITAVNFAAYRNKVIVENEKLEFCDKSLWGMWSMEQYITLLMGEIPRLSNDTNGYGPKGCNYIAEVDIPDTVQNAFVELKDIYSENIRTANPKYASPKI